MKRAIFILAILLSALLVNCDLNPQPFPPGGTREVPGSNGGGGSDAGISPPSGIPGLADAAAVGIEAEGGYMSGWASTGSADAAGPARDSGGDEGSAAGDTDATADSLNPEDAPSETKGSNAAFDAGVDRHAASDVVSE